MEKSPTDQFVLHRAAWLVPMNVPPLSDGAVLVQGDVILAAGPCREVKAVAPSGVGQLDHGSAALMPALVNAHTHLELSGLEGKIPLPQKSFPDWLRELLPHLPLMTPEAQREGFLQGKQALLSAGTALYGDITNGGCLPTGSGDAFPLRQAFLEVLGFDRFDLETAMGPDLYGSFSMALNGGAPLSLAAHACYSTSGELIRQAKDWSLKLEHVFSIHVAEHQDELEFLLDGAGFCRELLEGLGRWVPGWAPPRMSPVRYLEHLGVLDAQTLLVHAVHLTEDDWDIVARRRCPVCFCPRSNLHLNAGRADVEKAFRLGLTVALGTDSLASNTDLNLFSEAAIVLENYPGIPSDAVLSMVTIGGASALQCDKEFGTIEPGKRSALLAVSLPNALPPSQLASTIISHGRKGAWQWASCPRKS